MVAFDDENAVLKTLSFHQPTPWLVNLLHRHSNLWNRSWAIAQLASRTGDTLAAAALAYAVTSADYDLTRAEAASALGRFATERSRPALDSALADTSARVRKAAVESLGRVGGEGAVELVRRAWDGDASDQVRAAALTALTRLAPAASREAVAAGLRTRSYREAIQNAAIAAAVQRPDSGLVAELEAIAGEQPLPAVALAALAARGDASARAALARLLEDERRWVREWAREATGQGSAG
jgi:HEAT repeat protein